MAFSSLFVVSDSLWLRGFRSTASDPTGSIRATAHRSPSGRRLTEELSA